MLKRIRIFLPIDIIMTEGGGELKMYKQRTYVNMDQTTLRWEKEQRV